MKTAPATSESLISVDPKRVRPFAQQPRAYFDRGLMASLEASIKQMGQLQPGMVREIDDPKFDYELVDGERRFRICVKLGIPFRAVIVDAADVEEQFEKSVASNYQRAGHTPLEDARAIDRLCTKGGRSETYVAEIMGRAQTWVNQIRRLINLAPQIQKLIDPAVTPEEHLLPLTIAVNLARLDPARQLTMLDEIHGLRTQGAVDRIRRELAGTGVLRAVRSPKDSDRMVRRFVNLAAQGNNILAQSSGQADDFRIGGGYDPRN
jgi:ParB family chromosome partitioning protein